MCYPHWVSTCRTARMFGYSPVVFHPSFTTWSSALVCFGPVSRDRRWRKSSAPPTLTARRRRWRIGSQRRSYQRLQHRWGILTPSPMMKVFRPVAGGGGLETPGRSNSSGSTEAHRAAAATANGSMEAPGRSSSSNGSMEVNHYGAGAVWAEASHTWTGAQEGGVPGLPEPGGGGAYLGGPISLTIDSQPRASREQQVEWSTLLVAHLTSLAKWHALSVGGGLVRPTRPESKILLEKVLLQSIALVILLSFTTRGPCPRR